MEEGLKEFSHNCSKTFRSGAPCMGFKYYSCSKCRGLCIFADHFLKKYEKSEIVREIVQEKYFKNEFELIRLYLHETSLSSENEETKHDQEFEIIKKFHILTEDQKREVLRLHMGKSLPGNLHFHCQTNKSTKIKKLYLTCKHGKEWFPRLPRNAKKQDMLKYELNDVFLA